MMSVRNKLVIFIIALLALDQAVKIWIKTHMLIGEEFSVFGDWFKILFVENNGMAFGMELGDGKFGKAALSLFRIVAVGGIGWYILKLIREKAPLGVLFSFALIFCGAVGNIFDSLFYGMIFNDSHYQIASLFPDGGGYSSFLHGRVVDMLSFSFFPPVFNLADSYITIGVMMLLLFHRKFFSDKKPGQTEA